MHRQSPEERLYFAGGAAFVTTRWSLIVTAGDLANPQAHDALSSLCRDYWSPLYHFARRKGKTPEDAQDLTQGFILGLLEKDGIARADRARGKFRTFLLGAFSHYLANVQRHHSAQKRGGGMEILPLGTDPESTYPVDVVDSMTPELLYERSWALSLLERVMARLREEYLRADRIALFETLQPQLSGGPGRVGYAQLGAPLGMSEGALAVAVHRMRQRYAILLREEISATVADPGDVDEELRHLLRVISSPPH